MNNNATLYIKFTSYTIHIQVSVISSTTAVPKVWVNYPLVPVVGKADFAVGNDLKMILLV